MCTSHGIETTIHGQCKIGLKEPHRTALMLSPLPALQRLMQSSQIQTFCPRAPSNQLTIANEKTVRKEGRADNQQTVSHPVRTAQLRRAERLKTQRTTGPPIVKDRRHPSEQQTRACRRCDGRRPTTTAKFFARPAMWKMPPLHQRWTKTQCQTAALQVRENAHIGHQCAAPPTGMAGEHSMGPARTQPGLSYPLGSMTTSLREE